MNDPMVTGIAASALMNSSILSALVSTLTVKGVISVAEQREIYERALLMLEEQQGGAPASGAVFDIARALIEQHLRPKAT